MGTSHVTGAVKYTGFNSNKGPSPALWGRLQHVSDPNDRYEFFTDFLQFGGSVSTNVGEYIGEGGRWVSYEDTGGSIAQLASEVGGAVRITTDTTDNDECWMMPGGTASVFGKISDTAGEDKLLIFEARVRFGVVTSGNAFVGLSEEGLAAADTITDAGALASKDFIGFCVLEADPDALMFVYRKAGQAMVTKIASVQALTASTWYKVGFVFDPTFPEDKRIKVFVDGSENATYVTATNIATATFPDGEELHVLLGVKNSTTVAQPLDVDWVKVSQVRA